MNEIATLSNEERIGIGAAVVAHIALAAFLAWHASREPMSLAPPERIDVSLATEVSLESTAPDPSTEPAAALAPEIADIPEPPQEVVQAPPVQPVERPVPTPPRRTVERPTPAPAPTPRATRTPEARPTATPTPTATATQRPRGSSLSDDFLAGSSDARGASGSPAAVVGPAQQASIAQAIIRQLRPHWQPPSGVEVDQLVTVVRFRLNSDGSLSGTPEVLRTTGQTDSNRTQVSRHQEQAVRAVRLAAPFDLPEEYYSGWRVITSNFDNRLAQ